MRKRNTHNSQKYDGSDWGETIYELIKAVQCYNVESNGFAIFINSAHILLNW